MENSRALNTAVRRKGTILDLLSIDIPGLLSTNELKNDVQPMFAGLFPAVTYTYFLDKPEFGIFDIAKIEICGLEEEYTYSGVVNLHLTSSRKVSVSNKTEVVNTLIEMYGTDLHGREELDPNDLFWLKKDGYWSGRTWALNNNHALGSYTNFVYMIYLASGNENGFNLTIMNYSQLDEYFSGH